MKSVRYFQPYKQGENVVTNAILLLFSHINRLAPEIFNGFIRSVAGESAVLGPIFGNQESKPGGKSIVDAVIRQQAIDINIETKLGENLDADQIMRHFEGMWAEDRKGIRVLLGITSARLSEAAAEQYAAAGQKRGIGFAHLTFKEIAEYFEDATDDFRIGLNDILSDFRLFLAENKLLPPSENRMIINPCGTSLKNNERFGIYHDQPERSKVFCRYIGCYDDKMVKLVGEVKAVFTARVEEAQLVIGEQFDLPWRDQYALTDKDKATVLSLVNESTYYSLDGEIVRYYLTDGFVKTSFAKVSKGPNSGHRYFEFDGKEGVLSDLYSETPTPSLEQIATALSEKTWI